jgi:hypothetical protein
MSYTYLQEQGEVSSAASYSDIPASVLSKSSPTAGKCCSPDSGTESCPDSRSGTTSQHSTADRGEGESMSCAGDFHVRTSAPQERAQESPASDPVYGLRWPELYARYDRDTASWKTHPCLFGEDSISCSVTLPRWGTMRAGVLSALTTPEHLTSGTGYGYWPTIRQTGAGRGGRGDLIQAIRGNPNSHYATWPTPDTCAGGDGPSQFKRSGPRLATVVKYPTPRTRHLCGGSGSFATIKARVADGTITLQEAQALGSGGQLNPPWVEWLMGWPIEWTDLKPLEMGRFRQWLRSHGVCCQDREE